MIAAGSMPNCPFARVGRIASTPSTTTDTFSRVGRYQGRTTLDASSKGAGFGGSSGSWGLRRQKNDLRCLFGFFFVSVIETSLSPCQCPVNQAFDSTSCGRSAFHKNVVVRNAARFLAQLRRKHLLHISLAAQIGDLRLSGNEGIRTGRTHRNLVLHLTCSLQNDIRTLVCNERCL